MLAGVGLELVPGALSRPVLTAALKAMVTRHRPVFDRLDGLGDAVFLIDPTDLPVHFLLRPAGRAPSLWMARGAPPQDGWTAALRAPLLTLIDLLEGRVDGDAAFFGRDLVVEGDMGAVLILRNALEEGDVRVLPDLLAALGPAGRPLASILQRLSTVPRHLDDRLQAVQAALLRPQADRIARLEAMLAELQSMVRERSREKKTR